jgi:hypothetical protein
MKLGGIVRHGSEKDVVGFGHRAANGVIEFLADLELVEIESEHVLTSNRIAP